MSRVCIIGNSHLGAFKLALDAVGIAEQLEPEKILYAGFFAGVPQSLHGVHGRLHPEWLAPEQRENTLVAGCGQMLGFLHRVRRNGRQCEHGVGLFESLRRLEVVAVDSQGFPIQSGGKMPGEGIGQASHGGKLGTVKT